MSSGAVPPAHPSRVETHRTRVGKGLGLTSAMIGVNTTNETIDLAVTLGAVVVLERVSQVPGAIHARTNTAHSNGTPNQNSKPLEDVTADRHPRQQCHPTKQSTPLRSEPLSS